MIPYRGLQDLEYTGTCLHTVKRKYIDFRKNVEVSNAVRRFSRVNFGFEDIIT
jgi:hypothetical protein